MVHGSAKCAATSVPSTQPSAPGCPTSRSSLVSIGERQAAPVAPGAGPPECPQPVTHKANTSPRQPGIAAHARLGAVIQFFRERALETDDFRRERASARSVLLYASTLDAGIAKLSAKSTRFLVGHLDTGPRGGAHEIVPRAARAAPIRRTTRPVQHPASTSRGLWHLLRPLGRMVVDRKS